MLEPHLPEIDINNLQLEVSRKKTPYSPDCKPIENVWAILKQKVRSRHSKTLTELEEAINVWTNDPQITSACKAVINSMPRRMKALAASRGGFINY